MSVAKRRLNACPGASQSGFPGRLTRFMRSLWMPKSRAGSPILLIVPDTVENANTCKRSQVVPNRRSQQHTKPQGNRMLTIFVSLRQARWHTIYRKGRFTLWNRTWLESNLVGIELGWNRTWLCSASLPCCIWNRCFLFHLPALHVVGRKIAVSGRV